MHCKLLLKTLLYIHKDNFLTPLSVFFLCTLYVAVVVVQMLSDVWLFATPLTVALMLPCPLSPRVCSNSGPLSQECHPTISSSVAPFSQHQVFSSDFLYICGHVTQPFWIRFFFLFYLTESCIIHTQRSFVGNVNCNYFPFTGHPNHVCYCKEQHNAHFSTLSFFLLLGLSINFFFFWPCVAFIVALAFL